MSKFREEKHHLSVGAILKDLEGNYVLSNTGGLYAFMTGTVEDHETLEQCLNRELMEEFGMTCGIKMFAGVSQVNVSDKDRSQFKKSIIWFECLITGSGYGTPECNSFVRLKNLPTENIDIGRWPFIEGYAS